MYERVIESDKQTKIKRYREMFLRDLLIQNLIILRLQFLPKNLNLFKLIPSLYWTTTFANDTFPSCLSPTVKF